MPLARYPCPKCNRSLEQSGEAIVTVGDGSLTVAVFQCDECIVPLDLGDGGEPIESALTFCVLPDGRVIAADGTDQELKF